MEDRRAPVFRSTSQVRDHARGCRARRVVLANGCFDPLHVGHVRYLEGARALGDYLVVAVNDDSSTRLIKGEGRPVVPVGDRARVLSSLRCVDSVLVFSSPDVSSILRELRPAIHAKGTDYTVETVPERRISEELGIECAIVGDPKRHSSSDLIEKIARQGRDAEGRGNVP